MELKIVINLDNDAFDGDKASAEVDRILREFSETIVERGSGDLRDLEAYLRDINGNVVGAAKIVE